MRKFQQGGVSVYSVPQGIVQPNIPNSPVINAPLIPVVDMAPYLNAQMDSQRRKEVYDRELLRQQQSQLDSGQKTFFSVYDDVFGTVHNEGQRLALEEVKKKNGVDIDALLSATTPEQVTQQIKAVRKSAMDPLVQKVMGEVQSADIFLKRQLPQMEENELGEYNSVLDGYLSNTDPYMRWDTKKLDPNNYNRPSQRAIKPQNFMAATNNSLTRFANGIDISNPEHTNTFGRVWAGQMESLNKDQAVAQGYITYEGETPVPTQKGMDKYMSELTLYQQALQAGRDQKLEDATSTAQMRRRVNPPRGRSGSAEEVEKEESAVQKNWNIILSNSAFDAKYGAMDPFEPGMEWLYDYILSRTRMSDGTFTGTNDMNTVRKELDDIMKKVYTPTYNPQPTTTPSGLPVAPASTTTTPTAPRTGALRINPATGKLE